MNRREFITALGGATVAWPLAIHAQLPSRMRHVGVFLGLTASADDPGAGEILRPFKAAMAEAGWIEDQNIRLDYRFGGGDLAKIHAAAGDLVTLAPDLIYATGLPPAPENAHHSDRFLPGRRSGRLRVGGEPQTPRRQHHRVCRLGSFDWRQVDAVAARDCSQSQADWDHVQS